MVVVRVIGTSLDQQYREDLNYNFSLLASQINGSTENLDSVKKELLDMIDNLQRQILLITDVDWEELYEQLTTAINESKTAVQRANDASSRAESSTSLAVDAINKMNVIIDGFSVIGEYNNAEQYKKYNNVYFEGSSYIYINDIASSGNPPPNFPTVSNNHWRMSASKGANGDGGVSKVNGKEPDGTGEVTLTPSDIGAFPSGVIATENDLGLIKPDGKTILVNPVTGVASSSSTGGGLEYQENTFDGAAYVFQIEGVTEYKKGMTVLFIPSSANVGASYVDINGLGRKQLSDYRGQAINVSGTLNTITPLLIAYNGIFFNVIGLISIENVLSSSNINTAASSNTVRLLNEMKVEKVDETWIDVVLSTGAQSASNKLQYFKDALGFVHFEGEATTSSRQILFTIPVGYRPQKTLSIIPVVGVATSNVMSIQTNGSCVLVASADGSCKFNFSFKAAN